MKIAALIFILALSHGAVGAAAPASPALDAVAAAPDSHKILFENDRVRVLEVSIPPGKREPVHTHSRPSVMYVDRRPAIKYYDGTGKLVFQTQGSTVAATSWLEPEGAHSVENIGTETYHAIRVELKILGEMTHYPRLVADDVYFCGFSSPKSYGAQSYLIVRPAGNWMTDAPRYAPELVEGIEKLGGLSRIFLSHRDDVADADIYARHFGAKQIIHEADRDAAPEAEIVLRGLEPSSPESDLTILPVPGHTRGHCVLLYKDRFLFSGDHLEGDAATGRLGAFRGFCWYDWTEQTRSMERLKAYRFEWVLPGHGGRLHLPPERMQAELERLITEMKGD